MKLIKILVVNENENDFHIMRNLFSEIPHSRNYILYWCNSYEKAINAMLKSQYDLYLVYYRVGLYTGVDLLNEAIKSNVAEPVIIITEAEDHATDEEALQKGACACLNKSKLDGFSLERSIRYAIHHKKNLQKIKESENKFRIIFERSPDPILITDNAGNIHNVNHAAEKFFGIPMVKMLKINAGILYKNATDRADFISEIEQRGSVSNFIVDLVAANNQIRNCSISSFLQISQHGDNELFHTIIHDLTHIHSNLQYVRTGNVSLI